MICDALQNVCNGGQAYNLTSVTETELVKAIYEWEKVICVINRYDQADTKKLFEKIAKRKRGLLRAKRLAFWNSNEAELWLIYQPRCGTRPC